eukprot:scaffold1580_cov495-Pavlova_lutheri.AAC.1
MLVAASCPQSLQQGTVMSFGTALMLETVHDKPGRCRYVYALECGTDILGCPSGSGLVYEHSNWSVWLARWTASDKVFDMYVTPQSAEGRAPGAVAPVSMHCQLGQPVQAEHLWIA